jgi:pimeloyl-ACP methyl ester carboxylesterase
VRDISSPERALLAEQTRTTFAERRRQILLMSPWPESILAFAPTWDVFAAIGPVVAVDLPGYGLSESRPDIMTPESMGNFIPKLLKALHLERPHLVAPDIATPASLYAIANHPGLFASMIIGGGATDPTDIGSDLDKVVNAPSLDSLKGLTGEGFVKNAVGTITTYKVPDAIQADYLASYAGDRFMPTVLFVRDYPQALPRLAKRLPEIQTPCQIIVGRHDPFVPVSNAGLLRRSLPKSKLDVLECGHFAWEDGAAAYAALAKVWIEGGYAKV